MKLKTPSAIVKIAYLRHLDLKLQKAIAMRNAETHNRILLQQAANAYAISTGCGKRLAACIKHTKVFIIAAKHC